jgi:hypothetical protein
MGGQGFSIDYMGNLVDTPKDVQTVRNAPAGMGYGTRASQFANILDPSQINVNTATSPEEQARLRALESLAGFDPSIADPSTVQGAGQFAGADPFQFDAHGFQQEILARENAYKNELQQVFKNPYYANNTAERVRKIAEIAQSYGFQDPGYTNYGTPGQGGPVVTGDGTVIRYGSGI